MKLILPRILLLLLLFSATIVIAQERTITGNVTDALSGEALFGTTIIVKGTTIGAITDMDGNFKISITQSDVVLVFSSLGYVREEVVLGTKSVIDMALYQDITQLTEILVVGYGTQIKAELTGSITKVSGLDIQNQPVNSLESAMQGRAAGVYVNQGSGKLGQGMNIRVRGSASVSASNQPLYVIDGIPATSADIGNASAEPINPIADINPNDIQSIEVLKDASAAAIYGSRASNGVVIITTRRGTTGKTKVNVGYYTGVSTPTNLREFLNAAQYKELFTEAAENEGYDAAFEFEDNGLDINSTADQDWSKESFQKGGVSQLELSLSGGDDKTRFYISANRNDQTGIILGNQFTRNSARVNLDHKVNRKLSLGTNIGLISTLNQRVSDDNAFSNPIQLNALPPIQPKIDAATGELNTNTLYYNNLIDQRDGFNNATTYRTISTIFADWKIIPDLVFRSEYGIDFLNLQEEVYLGKATEDGGPTGYGYNSQTTVYNYTTNNTFTYNHTFAERHKVQFLAGMTYQESTVSGASLTGRGFPNDQFQKISSAARITAGSSTGSGYSFLSYLSRVNYVLDGKYLLAASMRVDGSSRFGANNRYGNFPAMSLGWIIGDEAFFEVISVVSFLKLRASAGVTGNAEIGNFASRGLYTASFYSDQSGIVATSLASPDLKWERTTQYDFGLDYGFFNNRVNGEIDYYIKNTNDLLLDVPLPSVNGFTIVTKNLGKLENKGIEFVLNTENLVGDFKWSTSFNIAKNVNKVTDLNGAIIFGGSRFLGQIRENESMAVFWGPKYAGVDPENGDALYYLKAGSEETTNDYDVAEEQKVGDPNPEFIGGLTNKFSYKGFDLNILMQFVYGNDIYNIAGFFQSVNGDYFDNQTTDQLERWQKAGDKTNIPQARLYASNGAGKSSRWVEDGSFLRVKSVNLGYNLPVALLERVKITNARVYVAASNLFTFTKYTGYDPEVNASYFGRSNVTLGHDFYTPPQAKTLTIGVNVGF